MSKPEFIDVRATKGEYMIAFDTSSASSGFLGAVKVTIEPAYLGLDETAAVNLIDHPLYKYLQQYVLSHLPSQRGLE